MRQRIRPEHRLLVIQPGVGAPAEPLPRCMRKSRNLSTSDARYKIVDQYVKKKIVMRKTSGAQLIESQRVRTYGLAATRRLLGY
jgi:hypothetical protein